MIDDRTPRQDLDAERSVLGAILLAGVGAYDAAREAGLRAEHFYDMRHEVIFRASGRLAARSEPIDATTLGRSLTGDEKRTIGDPRVLLDLVTNASLSVDRVTWHAASIVDAACLRQLAEAGIRISQFAATAPLDQRRDALERSRVALDAVEIPEEVESLQSAAELLPAVLDGMEHVGPRGVSTGIPGLDELLGGGLGRGQTVVIGARPSVGKSMLGVNLAAAAASAGVATMVFSHEMTRTELMQRFISRESGVPLTRVRSGKLVEEDWNRIGRATGRIDGWPLFIDDESGMTVADYRARIRKAQRRRRKPALVVSDYLQLVKPADRAISREQQVAQISGDCKALSKDFDLPLVMLAQLSRAAEQRRDSRPVLSDLRESGAIENDADVVALLHQEDDNEMELNVAKNRHGERGQVMLSWLPQVMRCTERAWDR